MIESKLSHILKKTQNLKKIKDSRRFCLNPASLLPLHHLPYCTLSQVFISRLFSPSAWPIHLAGYFTLMFQTPKLQDVKNYYRTQKNNSKSLWVRYGWFQSSFNTKDLFPILGGKNESNPPNYLSLQVFCSSWFAHLSDWYRIILQVPQHFIYYNQKPWHHIQFLISSSLLLLNFS